MSTVVHSARRVDARGIQHDAWLLVEGDRIVDTGSGWERPHADEHVDLGGATLVPGFIDLHVHGGGGHRVEQGPDAVQRSLAAHRAHGTTRAVVSLASGPAWATRSTLHALAELTAREPLLLGVHLEGPFLAPDRRGAHAPEYLREPDDAAIDALLGAGGDALRQVTIAPEVPGAWRAIDRFVDEGVAVAVGHTTADFDTARAAFDRGATLLTHAYNAMAGIGHREPGPVAAAIADDRVTLELVADGLHVHPSVLALTMRAAAGRTALVTDAMAAAASPDGRYRLGALQVEVREGRAVVAGTDTLAGSTLTQDAALRTVLGAGVDEVTAITALTATPARVLGLDDRFGLLAPGHAADLVVLDAANQVTRVWAAGRPV